MKKLNEIIERISFAYHSQDELSKDLINYIFLAAAALIIAFVLGLSFYLLKISL